MRVRIVSGLQANGRVLTGTQGTVVAIGRAQGADICFLDPRVSRLHATLEVDEHGRWSIHDLGGPGGTWLLGIRVDRLAIDRPMEIRLGDPADGPALQLTPEPAHVARPANLAASNDNGAMTVTGAGAGVPRPAPGQPAWPAPLVDVALGARVSALHVGRAPDNDVVLDDLQVSRYHAELRPVAGGGWEVVDLSSHNGTFLDGTRVTRAIVQAGQRVTIGATQLRVEPGALRSWPTASAIGVPALEARNLSVVLASGQRLLDDVSFRMEPGELLAVVGPTGSGKSTLLRALTGFRPPEEGRVLYGGRSLYDEFDELRRTIGYVPQDDILHTMLTVQRALSFGAELRFPSDVSAAEREARVTEVMAELGLSARADTVIDRLSGGQRKRTSVALELLTKPNLVFLDEPTSGLDPGYEKAVMTLLRELADGGRGLVVVTHSTQSLDRCDKVLFLAPGGVPAFLGRPADALAHFGLDDYPDVFTHLEKTAAQPARFAGASRPRDPVVDAPAPKPDTTPPPPPVAWVNQLSTLVRRQIAVTSSDKRNLAVLGGEVVIIALLLLAITGHGALNPNSPSGHTARTLLGALAISAAVIGVANTVREVVKEGAIYARERAGGLDPVAYLLSKMLVFGVITTVQLALLVTIAVSRADGPRRAVLPFPPLFELIGVIALTGIAAAALGLAISSVVSNSEKAMALVALVFIVQWLFSGATVDLQNKPGMRELSYLSAANWGLGAAGSTAGLRDLDRLSCGRGATPVAAGVAKLPCDARWRSDLLHWSTSVVWLLMLMVAALGFAVWALSRKDPVPSDTVLSPYRRRLSKLGQDAVKGAVKTIEDARRAPPT